MLTRVHRVESNSVDPLQRLKQHLQDNRKPELLASELKIYIAHHYQRNFSQTYDSLNLEQTEQLLELCLTLLAQGLQTDDPPHWVSKLSYQVFEQVLPILQQHAESTEEDALGWQHCSIRYLHDLTNYYQQRQDLLHALPYALQAWRLAQHYRLDVDCCVTTCLTHLQQQVVLQGLEQLNASCGPQAFAAMTQQLQESELTVELAKSYQQLWNAWHKTLAWVNSQAMAIPTSWRQAPYRAFDEYWYKKMAQAIANGCAESEWCELTEAVATLGGLDDEALIYFCEKLTDLISQHDLDYSVHPLVYKKQGEVLSLHLPPWWQWREQLQAARNQLTKACLEQFTQAQAVYQQTVDTILAELFHYSEQLTAALPQGWCVLGLGSLARKGLVLNSDIEFALLVDEDGASESGYLKALVNFWRGLFLTLADDWRLGEDELWQVSGFSLDGDILDKQGIMLKPYLCNTPSGYANDLQHWQSQLIKSVNAYLLGWFHGLQLATCIGANNAGQALYQQYQAVLSEQVFDASTILPTYWNYHAGQAVRNPPEHLTAQAVKEYYLTPVVRWLEHTLQYQQGLAGVITYEQIALQLVQANVNSAVAAALAQVYTALQYYRCQAVTGPLPTETRARLTHYLNYYIRPLYPSLQHALSTNEALEKALHDPYTYHLLYAKARSITHEAPIATWTAYHLSRRPETSIDLHKVAYTSLTSSSGRYHYYEALKKHLSDNKQHVLISLGSIPTTNGERLYWTNEYPFWLTQMASQLQCEQKTTMWLKLVGKKQAIPLAADAIKSVWNIKQRQPQPSELPGNHPVYQLKHLGVYMKLYPGLPGVQDALQYLYRRAFDARGGLPWSVAGLLQVPTVDGYPIPILISAAAGEPITANDPRLNKLDKYSLSKMLLF
ncbi:MAG: hypothetical protein K0S11_398, partial [Gammaproteobacteria bacterium]|nr:hypothetical protein [Gammaproteobacteria bacterium]